MLTFLPNRTADFRVCSGRNLEVANNYTALVRNKDWFADDFFDFKKEVLSLIERVCVAR